MKINFSNVYTTGEKNSKLNELIGMLQRRRNDYLCSSSVLKNKRFFKKDAMLKQERIKKKRNIIKYSNFKK